MVTMDTKLVAGPDQVSLNVREESVILHPPAECARDLQHFRDRVDAITEQERGTLCAWVSIVTFDVTGVLRRV